MSDWLMLGLMALLFASSFLFIGGCARIAQVEKEDK
jgi:hypothetical protein